MNDTRSHKPTLITDFTIFDKDGKVKLHETLGEKAPEREDTLELVVRHPDGLISEYKKVPVRSFVGNFSYLLNYALASVANSSLIKVTAGTNPAGSLFISDALAAAVDDTYGIFIGTNATGASTPGGGSKVNYTDFNLRNKVAHGTGTGMMEYGATTLATYTIGNSSISFTRTFINNSGATIIVKEAGIVGVQTGTPNDYVLLARDTQDASHIDLSVSVATAQTLSVTYTFALPSTVTGGFNYNWLSMLTSLLTATARNVLAYSTGAATSTNFSSSVAYCSAIPGLGITTHGILVGTSAEVVGASMYKLNVQNTTLTHSAHTVGTTSSTYVSLPTANDTTYYTEFSLRRDFNNATGSTITVREAGLAVAGNTVKALIAHVPTTSSYALANYETLRVKFTIKNIVRVGLGEIN